MPEVLDLRDSSNQRRFKNLPLGKLATPLKTDTSKFSTKCEDKLLSMKPLGSISGGKNCDKIKIRFISIPFYFVSNPLQIKFAQVALQK